MTRDEMAERTRQVLDRAVGELEGATMSGSSRLVGRAVLASLRVRRDYSDVLAQAQRLHQEVSEISAVLSRCVTRLGEAEAAEAAREPDGDAWWNLRIRRVLAAFELEGAAAEDLWVRTWLEAVERADVDRAVELAGLPGFSDSLGSTAASLRAAATALASSDVAGALEPVEDLVDRGVGGPGTRTRLSLLLVRILLSEFSDRSRVRAVTTRTVELAAGTAHESLARAALAEDQLANDDLAGAHATLDRAVSAATPATDALILLGEVHEREGAWAEADRCYDQALDADPLASRSVLLRRVPARLLVRAAGREGVEPATAVDLLDRALELEVPGDGDHPDKDVWVAKGDRLLDRAAGEGVAAAATSRADAAAAYVEGGIRYSWSGYLPRAAELFERACTLAPDAAEYSWHLAEALRLTAHRSDGVIDRPRMLRARARLEEGLRLRSPDPSEAWVLVLQSQIDEGLGDTDPTVPIERALLLDPDYASGYVFLALALRRLGWPGEAAEVMEQEARRTGTTDTLAFATRLDLCLDSGDHPAALALLDERARWFDDPELPLQRAGLLMRTGEHARAVEVLADDGSELGRLRRAVALALLGRDDPDLARRSREEFGALWADTRSGPTAEIAGWAAFGAGLLDPAIQAYRDLAARAPSDLPYERDLGQMLLARGDVAEGRTALERGVDACPYVDELRHLVLVELAFLRVVVRGEPHAEVVETVVSAVEDRVAARVADLLGRRRAADGVAGTAAAARTALHAGDPGTALRLYVALAAAPGLPEADRGIRLAAAAVQDLADDAFVRGRHDLARERWEELARVAHGSASEAVARSLRARRLVADLTDVPGAHQVASWVRDLDAGGPELAVALAEAVDVLVRDPGSLWAVRDGLVGVRDHPDVPPDVRRTVSALVDDLPLSRTYALGSRDAVSYPGFVSVRQLAVRLGAEVGDRLGGAELSSAVWDVQRRLQRERGVRIPWVYQDVAPELAPDQVDFEVYGRWVASTSLQGDPATWIEQLTDALDRTVRGHLFRMIGVDDVALWLDDWDLERRDVAQWRPADPIVDRLRLARLLRMLLREGVSVAGRQVVLAGLDAAGGRERGRDSATLDTLRAVRGRLGRAALGVRPGAELAEVPRPLEERLVRGLAPTGPVWQLPRPDATRLVADLRAWLDELPRRPEVVVVGDGRLRPFVWRLLANQGVVVVSSEELQDE